MVKQKNKSPNRKGGPRRGNAQSAVVASFAPPPPEAISRYAATLAHPFDGPEGVGVPRWPAVASEKETVKAFGFASCGTASNVGFVIANHSPLASTTTNVANVFHTLTSYTGTIMTTTIPTTGVSPVAHNGSIATTDYTNFLVKTRTVSCGLRIRYVGREDEMAGTVVIIRSPYDESLINLGVASARQWESTSTQRVTREWTTVSWVPADVDDFAYQGDSGSPAPFAQSQVASIGFMMIGTVGAFEWEYILHYEKSGNLARGATYNESHAEAVEHVSNVVAKQEPGKFSQILNHFGGRALELGKKLAHSYYMKHKGELFKRGMALAGRAAPLALTL